MGSHAPEFALLTAAQKRLIRKIGETEEHSITSDSGTAGPGWESLFNAGWIRIFERIEGYTIQFTLSGWEWWCRQVDAEEGNELQPLIYSGED